MNISIEKFEALNKIRIGDNVEVFVSTDEPRRRIKITEIYPSYKGDNSDFGIVGNMKDGALAWARGSQIKKLKFGRITT